MSPSVLEQAFLDAWRLFGDRSFADPEWEYVFAGDRNFRFDFAWPAWHVAVECDGDCHRLRRRFRQDADKLNLAVELGWKVFRFQRRHLVRKVPQGRQRVNVEELDHERRQTIQRVNQLLQRARQLRQAG